MKYVAKFLGPFLLSFRQNKAKLWRLGIATFVVLLVAAEAYAIPTTLQRAAGWEKTTATVVKAGWTSYGQTSNDKTSSVVKFSVHGQPWVRHFELSWELRNGAHISVWSRGSEATQFNPSRATKLYIVPLVLGILALLITLLLVSVINGLRDAVEKYDAKVAYAREQVESTRRRQQKEAVECQEAEEIVKLALEHGDTEISTSGWTSQELLGIEMQCPEFGEVKQLWCLVPQLGKRGVSKVVVKQLLLLELIKKEPGYISRQCWEDVVNKLVPATV